MLFRLGSRHEILSSSTVFVMCGSRKYLYRYLFHGRFFWFEPYLPPWNFRLSFILSLINFGCSDSPPPQDFPVTFHGVGTDIFWNHTVCHNSSFVNWLWSSQSHKSNNFKQTLILGLLAFFWTFFIHAVILNLCDLLSIFKFLLFHFITVFIHQRQKTGCQKLVF